MMGLSLGWRDWGSFLGAESEFDCVKIGRFGFLFDDFSIEVHLYSLYLLISARGRLRRAIRRTQSCRDLSCGL